MKRLAYFVGEPGVGKSTVVRAMLADYLPDFGRDSAPFEVWGYENVAYLGGLHHPVFPGTDRLSMSVQPLVLAWLAAPQTALRYELVVGEGDRLATGSFLAGAGDAGWEVFVLHLTSPDAAARRATRAAEHGLREQSPAWVAGRRTKLANLLAGLRTNPLIHTLAEADVADVKPAEVLNLLMRPSR